MKGLMFILIFAFFSLNLLAIKPADTPVFVKEFQGQVDFIKGRLMQLAEAMPDNKYNWSPAEGVRTVGEVYSHTADANYYFLSLITGDKSAMTHEKSANDKKAILQKLGKSFDVLKESAGNLTEEDLNKEVEAFGMKFSARNFMITLLNHCHEHLGQLIAYARMNGVVPPWSMQE
jgi:uncharacterized damage-inducible protein DinB